MGSKWTKAEKQFLKESLAKERLSLENIVVPGRSSERVRRQALKMGLIPKLRNPRISRSQRKKIREMRSQGYSVKQIAEFGLQEHPHRTANAVQKVLGRLRLVNKNRSRAARKRKIWRNGEKEEFYIFLRQYSATLSPQQIAKKFGVKKGWKNLKKC
ncbi:MAG: hypothetical protein NTV36_03665 [Candidatus Staskawiczbacteria bacterium]|nr:hypothetical protein [Candidatus Staskawiczbacteria bacterium]